jgi:general secretion pathway protein D
MTRLSAVYAPIGLALTLGLGSLHAQANVQQGQPEAQPAPPVLTEPKPLAGLNLDFTRGAKLGEVFQTLGKQAGVSIVLHAAVAAQETTTSADLRGMNFQRALDTLMLQNDLFYKVMDASSIMVFKKTPQNLQDFETKLIKTFYLANAEVDVIRQTVNALMPQLRVFIDKRLNAVTVSGNPGDLAKAQQIVGNLDRGRGEVRLQMEIIEVSQKASVAAGLLPMVGAPPSQDANAITPDRALAKVMQDGDSKLLASPDVRVIAGEAAEVKIGRKLALAQAGSSVKTTSAGKAEDTWQASQRDDLGVKVKVRPRLHPNHELTLEVEYAITDPLKPGEPGRPGLSERIIKTSVQMKDGETMVFGGLLEDEGTTGGKEKKDRLLVIKAVVVRWGEQ